LITPSKSRSAPLPGDCRTANRSTPTLRPGFAPYATAATSAPHFAPQQSTAAKKRVSKNEAY
jgi:hypothetical protein